jgi:hypothetical protein
MTDERLSRRARRAQEEDALSGELPTTTGSVHEASPDTQSLSRRDRRRLERVAHPVEVWTAEEEMIATGQIPKVTPDVIAEQERIAREKAAQAQAEAEAASAELRRVSLAETSAQRVAEVTGVTPAVAAETPRPATAMPTPAAPASSGPPSMQHLFPPGSLQARAFAESQAREEAEAAARDTTPSVEQSSATPPLGSDDGAEEIRRLAAAAMANIEKTAPVPTPDAVPRVHAPVAPESEPAAQPTPFAEEAQTADRYAMPELAAAEPEPLPARLTPQPYEQPPAPQGPVSTGSNPVAPAPQPPAAASAPFGFAPVTPGSGATPTVTPGTGATPTLTPGTGATPVVPPNPWAAHPLDAATAPAVDVNAYAPLTDVPQPDLSAVINPTSAGTFSPHGPSTPSGATPLVPGAGTGATPMVPPGAAPTTTGSIPTIRRGPELQPAGGARHFRWAHYLVLFALMFIVGVVVFQVFRLNS